MKALLVTLLGAAALLAAGCTDFELTFTDNKAADPKDPSPPGLETNYQPGGTMNIPAPPPPPPPPRLETRFQSEAAPMMNASDLPLVTAAQWGSQPDPFPKSYQHQPTTVLIHHAGVAWKPEDEPFAKLRGLQSWGKSDKGWHDVPYHFLIAPDGRIFEGRALQYKPDTNTDFDTTGYVNIQLWGNFEEQRVSPAQLVSTALLSARLADQLGMASDQIVTHKDVAPGQTSCPGKDFYRYVESGLFETWVNIARAGKTPPIRLLPPAQEGPTEMIPGG